MSWPAQDNKHYRGILDRNLVSMTEPYEVSYFIEDYLRSGGYALDADNRARVRSAMAQFIGKAPIARTDLTAFLNRHFGK